MPRKKHSELIAGLFVIAALAVLLGVVIWLGPGLLRTTQQTAVFYVDEGSGSLGLEVGGFAQINDMTTTPQYLDNLRELLSWTWDDFDDFWEKYGEENPDNWYKLASVMIPLNHLGILLNEGLIDPMLLWHWRGPMPMFWDKFEPILFEYRRRFESPPKGRLYEFIEDLNITMKETRG